MVTTNCTFNSLDFEIYAGLDVSKKSISVTFLSRGGFIRSLKMPYDSAALISYVRRQFPGKRVSFVYEAGPTGYGLYDDLKGAGYFCMVAAPSMILKAPGERVKTDRLDSRKLAEQLRADQLKGIHVPTGSYRYLRHLTQLRRKCVARQTAAKLQIKSLLLLEQISFPLSDKGKCCWSSATIQFLEDLTCPSVIRFKLDRLLSHLEFWHQEVLKLQRELSRFSKMDPELKRCVELLTTLPGIGQTIAIYLLSRIGDWRHLKNSRQLAAFFGLIPSEHSTGEKVRRGPITRTGDRLARALLIEAAWVAIKKDPELVDCYQRLCNGNNRNKDASRNAIVAVARRLTTRIYAVLTEQRTYLLRQIA